MQSIWEALYDNGAEVVLSGHEHNYERFAPQDASGHADSRKGLRQFVVGTGGRSHYALGGRIANSEVGNDSSYGVLRLTLLSKRYGWKFIAATGSFTDSGRDNCH